MFSGRCHFHNRGAGWVWFTPGDTAINMHALCEGYARKGVVKAVRAYSSSKYVDSDTKWIPTNLGHIGFVPRGYTSLLLLLPIKTNCQAEICTFLLPTNVVHFCYPRVIFLIRSLWIKLRYCVTGD